MATSTKDEDGRRTKGSGGIHFNTAKQVWVATVYVPSLDGKRRQKRATAKTEAAAKRKLRDLKDDIENGRITTSPKQTVKDWLKHWIENIHGGEVRPNTRKDYATTIRLHIVPHIGGVRIGQLTPAHVRHMQDTVKKSSTRNAQKAHQVLRRALRDAITDGLVDRNVAALVPNPQHIKKRRGAFDGSVVLHVLKKAIEIDEKREHGPYLASRWAAAFLTGARRGELLGLTWNNVDFNAGVIDIAWQLQQLQQVHGCGDPPTCGKVRPGFCPDRRWDLPPAFEYEVCHRSLVWTRPKSEAGQRYVPIVAALEATLKVHRETVDSVNPHNLVWHHDDGRPISPRDDSRAWADLMEQSEVTKGKGASLLHEARNTAATTLMESGVDARVIQSALGHADILMTRKYQVVNMPFAKKEMASLNALSPS